MVKSSLEIGTYYVPRIPGSVLSVITPQVRTELVTRLLLHPQLPHLLSR